MSKRAELIHSFHRAGLRLDDASVAADVALREMRAQRDELILLAREAGMTYRQIGAMVGLDHARVIRVVTAASC